MIEYTTPQAAIEAAVEVWRNSPPDKEPIIISSWPSWRDRRQMRKYFITRMGGCTLHLDRLVMGPGRVWLGVRIIVTNTNSMHTVRMRSV